MPRRRKNKREYIKQPQPVANEAVQEQPVETEEEKKERIARETKERQEQQKRETAEQNRLHQAFQAKMPKNREAFNARFKYSKQQFASIARANGWVYENTLHTKGVTGDARVIDYLYDVARDYGFSEVTGLCEEIVNQPADTNEKREALALKIQNTLKKILDTDKTMSNIEREKLEKAAQVRYFFSDVEFEDIANRTQQERQAQKEAEEKKEQDRLQREAREKERAEVENARKQFSRDLTNLGWGVMGQEMQDELFADRYMLEKGNAPKELKEAMDAQYQKLLSTRLDEKRPVANAAAMLQEYADTFQKFAKGTEFEKRANETATRISLYNQRVYAEQIVKEDKKAAEVERKQQMAGAREAVYGQNEIHAAPVRSAEDHRSKDDWNAEQPRFEAGRSGAKEEGDRQRDAARDIHALEKEDEYKRVKQDWAVRARMKKEFPFSQREFDQATIEQRAEKLKDYFKLVMAGRAPIAKMERALDGQTANAVIRDTVAGIHSWETCQKLAENALFADAVLGSVARPMSKGDRLQAKSDYYQYQLKPELATQSRNLRIAEDKKFLKDLGKAVADLDKKIDKVDYNLFGKGSQQFDEMKNSIKALKTYAEKELKMENDKIDLGKEAKLYEKQYMAAQKIRAYLDHKQDDFNKESDRRNDKGRQKREQKRIVASVEMLKDLEKSMAITEKRIYEGQLKWRDNLQKRLENEQKKLEDPKISDKEYLNSLAICTDLVNRVNGNMWYNRNPENAYTFAKLRHQDYGVTYTNAYVKELLGAKSSDGSKALAEGYNRIYPDPEKPKPVSNKRLTLEDVWKIQGHPKNVDPLVRNTDEFSKEVEGYQKNLFSYQTKVATNHKELFNAQDRQIEEQMQRAAQPKQAKAGRGMGKS